MQRRCFMLGSLVGGLSAVPAFAAEAAKKMASGVCSKAVYLTFDTGHMGIAQLVAQVLQKHKVPVTFFAANEATKEGGSSLGDFWASW